MYLASIVLSEAVRAFDKLYDYQLPDGDGLKVEPGMRVLVPFGAANRICSAWVIKITESGPAGKLKKILNTVDQFPLLSPEMIKLAEWMRIRYFCTWGDAIRLMIPAAVNLTRKIKLYAGTGTDNKLSDHNENISTISEPQKSILEKLEKYKDGLSENDMVNEGYSRKDIQELIKKKFIESREIFDQQINEKTVRAVEPTISKEEFDFLVEDGKIKSIHYIRVMELLFAEEFCTLQDLLLISGVSHSTVRSMSKKGWISYFNVEVDRNPFDNMVIEKTDPPELTIEQLKVLDKAIPMLKESKLNEMLLHGITGSGKTEVYLKLIENNINLGKTAIVLVPEISLTPQMTSRFTGRFGKRVAIQHSRLSQGERYDQWRKIKSGEVDVVIGARSAVYAPLSNLGIIIVDEEHELSYKSENTPKYDARHIARARCNINGALLVMGSATPSIETYHRALNNKILLETMTSRPNALPLPEVIMIDMREELKEGNRSIISRRLEEELVSAKGQGKQSILFLNRRGYASFLLCRDCGYTMKCPNCSVSLTVHKQDQQVICHYCGYSERIPRQCPSCSGSNIKTFGTGTQKVEDELLKHPAGFKIIRMDLDTTSGKQGHQKLLDSFRKKEADILIGTQMVAKGHDFPDVTRVGILAADSSLFTSDFRASERTFQLITQASGRAGRGSDPGRVILQAFNVDDYAIQTAMSQDYESFYQKEIIMRQKLISPPFCHIGHIIVSGENHIDAKRSLEHIKEYVLSMNLDEQGFICSDILPSPVFIVRNRARWRLIIKMSSVNRLVALMSEISDRFAKLKVRGTDLSLDIDPPGML